MTAVAVTVGGIAVAGASRDRDQAADPATDPPASPDPSVTESAGAGDPAMAVPPRPGDPIYVRWTARETLPSCGVLTLGMLGEQSLEERDAWRCLDQARDDGTGAELATSATTIEGDPVRSWYRVTPDGRLEQFYDASEDKFGSGEWEFFECALPVVLRRGCGG